MKKRTAMLLLSLSLLTLAAGCGTKEEDSTKTEETAQEESFELTNDEGKVVAADIENLEEYVTLGEYKNLEVEEAPKQEITDEYLEEYIHNVMVSQTPVEVTEDRAVQEDDTVNIDYTGYMDGETFDGGSAEGTDLRIGSGSFISGFEEGLVGHKKGEEVTLDLNFPDPYQNNPDFSGKPVQFKVTINSISEPPAFGDAWVTENTDYESAEEFRAEQKTLLQKYTDTEYESQVKSDLFSKVVENSEIKSYPEQMMEDAKKDVERRIEETYAAPSGLTLEEYYEQSGISQEDADQMVEEMAKSSMDQNLITQAILNSEGITLTEEQYQEEEEKYAQLSGFENAEAMKNLYSESNLGLIRDSVLWNRACDVLMETAVITETQAEE
ncbi:MAG TPA: trigger factor [Candidatus Blautia merdavium]|uniref:peptidylprolyl isomerase n=1 Tax=Candidatus Blautia merdavium TaxID=2838494 RepID=A0A9D2TDC7_9FIRM|nr:trigger factor [Candidatus Blautia merdavium]